MTKSFPTASPNTLSPDILALTPRQVLLSKPDMVLKERAERDGTKLTLEPDQKALLHRLIGHYFSRSGFSKTVKKFISEAEIEKDDLVDGSISLEEIFREHFENGNRGSKNLSRDEIEEINGKSKKDLGNESLAGEGAGEKKKKKKQKKIDAIEDGAMVSAEASKETSDKIPDDHEKKHKDKKRKGKSCSESVDGQGEGQSFEIKHDSDGEGKAKHKKKKRKKDNESNQEPDVTKAEKVNGETENEGDKPKSKKRKLDNQTSYEHGAEKASKKQKKNKEQAVDNKKNEENNDDGFQRTPEKQPDAQDNSNLEKSGAESATEKYAKKIQNGSKEPKKPFQRVNVEEVVFTDERLQDNSYWAKGGAETGYGAKAQEVLGQVRGRDFRHEKTKKKRGSYRGGLIDLQTHSVKFDNSDEE